MLETASYLPGTHWFWLIGILEASFLYLPNTEIASMYLYAWLFFFFKHGWQELNLGSCASEASTRVSWLSNKAVATCLLCLPNGPEPEKLQSHPSPVSSPRKVYLEAFHKWSYLILALCPWGALNLCVSHVFVYSHVVIHPTWISQQFGDG